MMGISSCTNRKMAIPNVSLNHNETYYSDNDTSQNTKTETNPLPQILPIEQRFKTYSVEMDTINEYQKRSIKKSPNIIPLSDFFSIEDAKMFFPNLSKSSLDKFFVHSLSSSSEFGNTSYYCKLLLFNEVGIEIPESLLKLVLNEGGKKGEVTEFSVFFNYKWPIKSYIGNFNLEDFDHSNKAFYHLFLKMVNANSDDILSSIISNFFEWSKDDISPTELFVMDFNKKAMNLIKPYKKLTIISSDDANEVIDDLVLQIEANNLDIADVLFTLYIKPLTEDEAKNKLSQIFASFLNQFSYEKVEYLLIPQIYFSIKSINLGIEFPRDILKPINEFTNKPFEDENKLSRLRFDVKELIYNSEYKSGFNFVNPNNFNFNKSEMLNTGLSISFTEAKIDVYKEFKIPEVDSDSYPLDFMGIYVKSSFIELPLFWKRDEGQSDTIKIVGNDILIGIPEGISGNFILEGGSLVTSLPGNIKFILNEFIVKLHQDTISHSSIKGVLEIIGENENHKIEVEGSYLEDEYVFYRKGTNEVVLKFPKKLSSDKLANKIFVQISPSEFWFVDLND